MEFNSSKQQRQAKSRLNRLVPTDVEQLISLLKHNEYNAYLRVIAANQGIATDQLSKFIKSNNHHNASQYLNEMLIPLGFVIAKFRTDKPSVSWRWYLMEVKRALQLGIDKRLRLKIFCLLEAANDQ
ncbi:hypothetical protein [Rheinheimera hassiensis]|uniref:hypothetical protein n=1 Tax=Rheinheimera hassiensis TaxID=1193627 RepID=UPI001F070294|nr:hypothetical protein [Rheinheimera hassiensis]